MERPDPAGPPDQFPELISLDDGGGPPEGPSLPPSAATPAPVAPGWGDQPAAPWNPPPVQDLAGPAAPPPLSSIPARAPPVEPQGWVAPVAQKDPPVALPKAAAPGAFQLPPLETPMAFEPPALQGRPAPKPFEIPSLGPDLRAPSLPFQAPSERAPAPFEPTLGSTPTRLPGSFQIPDQPVGSGAAAVPAPMPSPSSGVPAESRPPANRPSIRPPQTAPPLRLPAGPPPFVEPPETAPQAAGPRPVEAGAAPWSFMALAEAALRLPFALEDVVRRCERAAPPPLGLALAHALAWASASLAIRTGFSAGGFAPPLGGLGSASLTVGAGLALAGVALLSFLGAGVIHGIGRVSGGSGPFLRGFQILSLLSIFMPLGAALQAAPGLWWLPGAASAYLMARLVARLYRAPIAQVSLIVGGLALLGTAGQFQARRLSARWKAAAGAAAQAQAAAEASAQAAPGQAVPGAPLPESLQQLQQANSQLLRDVNGMMPLSGDLSPDQKAVLQELRSRHGAAAPAAGASGAATGVPFDAAKEPAGALSALGALPAASDPSRMTPQQQAALRASAEAMLQQVRAALDDPRTTEGMSPQELARYKRLRKAARGFFTTGEGGPRPSAAETRELLQQLEAAGAAGAAPKKKRRRRPRD